MYEAIIAFGNELNSISGKLKLASNIISDPLMDELNEDSKNGLSVIIEESAKRIEAIGGMIFNMIETDRKALMRTAA